MSDESSVMPLVVRPREAWRMLNCSNYYGYKLLAAGELESFVDGNARKVTTKSIRRSISRQIAKAGKAKKSPAIPFKDRRFKKRPRKTATNS
jgi:hypothetical protein